MNVWLADADVTEMLVDSCARALGQTIDEPGFMDVLQDFKYTYTPPPPSASSSTATSAKAAAPATTANVRGVDVFIRLLSWNTSKLVPGNAAVCVERCARIDALVPLMGAAIEPLVAMMASARNADVIKKNAALAVARLARHEQHRPRIRELRGMEMLYHLTSQGVIPR